VVQVAADGRAPAARVAAGRLADLDQVAQAGRRPVAGCSASLVAGGTAERRDGEGPGPVTGPGAGTGLGLVSGTGTRLVSKAGAGTGSRPGLRLGPALAGGWPGAGATVGDRAAIGR